VSRFVSDDQERVTLVTLSAPLNCTVTLPLVEQ
jgi:hypothetical protein